MVNLGYCCINTELDSKGIRVNRGMIKRTFEQRGLDYVSELTILNLVDCLEILKWNKKNNISIYRLSSDMFPWFTNYKLEDLPKFTQIKSILESIGSFVKENNMRVGFHPGPFNVLASLNENVVLNTIDELNKTAQILDLMCLDRTNYYSINIHVGITKPSREEAMIRFCDNFQKLSDSAKSRLTVENDDKENSFSVKMLYDGVHKNIGIPIIIDQHHYNYGTKDLSFEESFKLATSTFECKGIKPLTHMSSPRTKEDDKARNTAHADYIYEKFENFGIDVDCEIEAKMKEQSVFKYRKDFLNV